MRISAIGVPPASPPQSQRSSAPHKVLSLFEPHTVTIRKGKISKTDEFGSLVTTQEAEHQIVTAYEIHAV